MDESSTPTTVGSNAELGAGRFAPTVVMPGGETVTPEGWMWVLGFALAGCEWAIEAAERDGVQQRAMDYERRRRIYWQEREIAALETRLADEKAKLTAMQAPNAADKRGAEGDSA